MEIIKLAHSFFKTHLAPEAVNHLDLGTLVLVDPLSEKDKRSLCASLIYQCYTKVTKVLVYLYVVQRSLYSRACQRVYLKLDVKLYSARQ
jgi:hypothetical protein